MKRANLNTSVGDWVTQYPAAASVFARMQIDYHGDGDIPLAEACWIRQLDPQVVLKALEMELEMSLEMALTGAAITPDLAHWQNASLSDLCTHIEQTHHAYLREELPRLTDTVETVLHRHHALHPSLPIVQNQFVMLRDELEPHMLKEEQVLFPAIRQLERRDTRPSFPFGSIAAPIAAMEQDHEAADNALTVIHELTNNYAPPGDACDSYREMLTGLQRLERDLRQHIHKENNVLFPRAIALENSRAAR